jgi:hypothetical protein
MEQQEKAPAPEFDYARAAKYTIKRLGGREKVEWRIGTSRGKEKFIEYLGECIKRWWEDKPPYCRAELLYEAILRELKNTEPTGAARKV